MSIGSPASEFERIENYFEASSAGMLPATMSPPNSRNESHGKSFSGSTPCTSFDRRFGWWRADFWTFVQAVSRLPKRQS